MCVRARTPPYDRDLTANLMSEVCRNVYIEPTLQPITGEALPGVSAITELDARIDVAASGFWGGCFERPFSDVRVFNPHALSNREPLPTCYCENIKKRTNEQRVREIEHGSFTPLVMSLTGKCCHSVLQEAHLFALFQT